ncbi:MAG: hypothetical protein LM562_04240 [Pyrobaculum sp.]|nr:hypothetical protein [Pyrobaculum sp.]
MLYLRRFFEGFRCRLRPPAVCILYKPRETPPPGFPHLGGTVYEGLFFAAAGSRAYRKERVPLPEALERIENGAKAAGGFTHNFVSYAIVFMFIIYILYTADTFDLSDFAAAATGGSALVFALVLR